MTRSKTLSILLGSMLATGALACGGDDDEGGDDQADGADDGGDDGDGGSTPTRLVVRIENVAPWTVLKSAAQNSHTDGATGPLSPGQAFEIALTAGKGQSLSFAAMLGESNDWFFAPGPEGIALFDGDGAPRSGDITAEVALWDAGTEIDQEPAVGPDTGPQQASPDQGAADPDAEVAAFGQAAALDDGSSFQLPAVDDMIRVTLTPSGEAADEQEFVLRIENVSTSSTLMTSEGAREIHVSPLTWALHMRPAPFFEEGEADRDQGLERIAESGAPTDLAASIAELTGFATPVSPGVFVVHAGGEPIYSTGQSDRGQGLERIAEDGNPAPLGAALEQSPPAGSSATGLFDTAIDAAAPGPALPGQTFEVEVEARPGDRLSFAAMYGMSNDWFFATPSDGIELFDGEAPAGDVTGDVAIYDIGSEIDQEIAIGAFTAPQQPAPDTGPADPAAQVRLADYPVAPSSHLRVTVDLAE